MSNQRIQQLDEALINQIAAGEVIERPASALKELLENSFDAGATDITVTLEKGGMQRIEVIDNGLGIVKEDLLLAISRHATSKICTVADLSCIHTLGFRGEALAAMGAISQFTLTSCHADSDHAWQIQVAGGKVGALSPMAHPQGTRVQISELFYNTPARRRFLKSEQTELAHCVDVCQRFALSSLSTHLHIYSGTRRLHDWPATSVDPHTRISTILGEAFLEHAASIQGQRGPLSLQGFVTRPTHPPQHTQAYFYINGRFIRDRVLQHAIKLAYSTVGFERTPFSYVLYLTIATDEVDVNVHPAKLEVRLHDSRLVHDFITQEIIASLQTNPLMHKSDPTRFIAEPTRKTAPPSRLNAPPVAFHILEKIQPSRTTPLASSDTPILTDHASSKRTELGMPLCLLGQRLLVAQPVTQDGLILIDLPSAQSLILEAALNDLPAQPMERLAIPLLLPFGSEPLRTFLHSLGLPIEALSAQEWVLRQCANCWQVVELKICLSELIPNQALWEAMLKCPKVAMKEFITYSSQFMKPLTRVKDCQPLLAKLSELSAEQLQQAKIVRKISIHTLAELA